LFKVSRVACGSSHSICWTTQESQLTNAHEPVLFAASKDPLGTHLVTAAADNSSCLALGRGGSTTMTSSLPVATAASGPNAARLSLSKILLSLESNAAKQKALQHVLNALQIMYAREAVVAAIAPHNSVSSPSHNNNNSSSSSNSTVGNVVNNKRSAEQHAGYAAGFNTLGRLALL
jgi:E3 ubiquitin-protein ligase HERC2